MNIAVVIPAYNEAKRIGSSLEELSKYQLSIFVVDDGSTDATSKVANKYPVSVIRHEINLGKGAALKTGCIAAFESGSDAVIFMDSDGQHLASDLPKFMEALKREKVDIAFGSRNLNLKSPLVRVIGNKLASAVIVSLFGIYLSDLICGFRAVNKKAFERMKWQSRGYEIETEMVILTAKLKLKYCEVPIQTIYYDKFKGVSILDAISVLFQVMKWRVIK